MLTVTDFRIYPSGISLWQRIFTPPRFGKAQSSSLKTDIPVHCIRCVALPAPVSGFELWNPAFLFPEKLLIRRLQVEPVRLRSARESTSFSHGYSFLYPAGVRRSVFPVFSYISFLSASIRSYRKRQQPNVLWNSTSAVCPGTAGTCMPSVSSFLPWVSIYCLIVSMGLRLPSAGRSSGSRRSLSTAFP